MHMELTRMAGADRGPVGWQDGKLLYAQSRIVSALFGGHVIGWEQHFQASSRLALLSTG